MKRGFLLRAFLGLAFTMFVATGLKAQVQVGDYVAISGDNTTAIDSVTTGTTTRLYVRPDMYYHPNFTVAGSWALTPDFTWTWTVPAGNTVDAGESTADNWVQVTWGPVAAAFNVTVAETAPAAFGGCSGDTNVWVQVLAAPTIGFAPDAAGTYIGNDGANDTLIVCEGDTRLSDNVRAVIAGVPNMWLRWNFEIATLNSSGSKDLYYNLGKVSQGAAQYYAVNNDTAGALTPAVATASLNLTRPTDGLYNSITVTGTKRITIYTYTINGINDRISRKSDYLANPNAWEGLWTWYDNAAERVVIRVNPAPVTGPIYHIPNNWSI